MTGRSDIQASFNFATKIAHDQSIEIEELVGMLRSSYEETKVPVLVEKKAAKKYEYESLVTYCHPKKGALLAHTLQTHADGSRDLRVHMLTEQDADVTGVSFSEELKKGYWSKYR